jgi:hypothetical protein
MAKRKAFLYLPQKYSLQFHLLLGHTSRPDQLLLNFHPTAWFVKFVVKLVILLLIVFIILILHIRVGSLLKISQQWWLKLMPHLIIKFGTWIVVPIPILHQNASNLTHQNSCHEFDTVTVGNGSGLQILHTGSATFNLGKSNFHLNNILHCPQAATNLISINRFCLDNNC